MGEALTVLPERDPRMERRQRIIQRLDVTQHAWMPWSKTPPWNRPTFVLDDYFNALADAGDFNRQYPDLAIPPRSDTPGR